MANFCLPKKFTSVFIKSLQDGTIKPSELALKSSKERRELFTSLFGEDNAKEVNALFESKLLLKNQQAGLQDWIKSVAGLKPEVKQDLADRIQNMSRVLQPEDEQSFLADLARQKLGLNVSMDEAEKIFDASTKVKEAEGAMLLNDNQITRRAWGRARMDLNDTVNSMKPNGMTFKEGVIQVLGVPKQALTGVLHFTAPFVQNWGMMSTKQWAQAWPKMFQYFADEENYKNLMADIISHPDYELAKDGALGLTDLGDKFTAREEANQSRLLETLNEYVKDNVGGPNVFRASSRGFTGFNNYVRFYRFVDLLNAARLAGEDVSKGSSVIRDLSAAVNDFSGRGKIWGEQGYGGSLSGVLNAAMFAPKKVSATIRMFDPTRYLGATTSELRMISPTARNAAIRQLSGSLIATGAILSLATAFGAHVELDPTATDFMEINIGGQRFDLTGGNAIYTRLLARIVMNQEVTAKGKEIDFDGSFQSPSRASAIGDFLRNKLSPVAGMITDALFGKDPVGRPFNVDQEARDKLVPIVGGQFIDYWQNNPDASVAMLPSLFSLFGVSMRSPLPVASAHGISVWGEPSTPWSPAPRNVIDREIDRLGGVNNIPQPTINGVKLSTQQYKDYIATSGQQAKSMIMPLISSPKWDSIPDAQKLSILKGMVQAARGVAAAKLQAQTANDPNGLLQQSLKKQGIQ